MTSPGRNVGRIVAIVSQKGGVGKTTTAVNLAAALASRGVKTLLIDADPQGSVRFALGMHDARLGLSDYVAGTVALHEIVHPTVLPWLRAVVAGSVTEAASHDEYQHAFARSPLVPELLERARDRGYVAIVDTPPGLGPISHRVLLASDGALIPLQSEPLALQTTAQALRGIKAAAADNPRLTVDGILLTMTDPGNATAEAVAQRVREQLPAELVLDMTVPRSIAAIESLGAGQPLVLRSPDDPAARAYTELAQVLMERMA